MNEEGEETFENYPEKMEMIANYTNYGVGKGNGERRYHKKRKRKDVYIKFKNNPDLLYTVLHLSPCELDFIIDNIPQKESLFSLSKEKKITMALIFISYWKQDFISHYFGLSQSYVGKILDETLPLASEFFLQYVTNIPSLSSSSIHSCIRYITDCTIHKTRKPSENQSKFYNGHYKLHGVLTHLLIDYDYYIVVLYLEELMIILLLSITIIFAKLLNHCFGRSRFLSN